MLIYIPRCFVARRYIRKRSRFKRIAVFKQVVPVFPAASNRYASIEPMADMLKAFICKAFSP